MLNSKWNHFGVNFIITVTMTNYNAMKIDVIKNLYLENMIYLHIII